MKSLYSTILLKDTHKTLVVLEERPKVKCGDQCLGVFWTKEGTQDCSLCYYNYSR